MSAIARTAGTAERAGPDDPGRTWLRPCVAEVSAPIAAVHLALRPGPNVRASTAFRALPEESAYRLAQEAARLEGVRLSVEDLIRMPVGGTGSRQPADGRGGCATAGPAPRATRRALPPLLRDLSLGGS